MAPPEPKTMKENFYERHISYPVLGNQETRKIKMILQYCNIFGWELEVVQWEDLIKLYFYYEVWHIGIYIHKNIH